MCKGCTSPHSQVILSTQVEIFKGTKKMQQYNQVVTHRVAKDSLKVKHMAFQYDMAAILTKVG